MYGPVDLDEGNYATIGMIISRGAILYRDIGDSKPPLIYYINVLISLLFGSNVIVLRLIFAAVSGATGVFVFLIARKVYGMRTGVISAYLFVLFSSSSLWGYHSPTNIYSSFMESIAIYFLIIAFFLKEREASYTIIAGVFIALSVLIRQTSILLFATAAIWFLTRFSRHKPFHASETLKQTLRRLSLILLGGSVVFLPTILYFIKASGFNDMIHWVLMEPLPGLYKYTPWTQEFKREWLVGVFLTIMPLFVFAAITVKRYLMSRLEDTSLFVLWFILPILFFVLGPVPAYPHYYYQILPSLCIMAGEGLRSFCQSWRKVSVTTRRKGFRRLMPTRKEWIGAIVIISVISSLGSNVVAGQAYAHRNDVQLAMKVADFIKNRTEPNEKIFVFESLWPKIGPLMYYLSERPPPLPRPFFFTYNPQGVTSEDVKEVEEALLNQDVKYVVVIGGPRPPDWNSTKILLNILSKYYPFYVVERDYVIYPGLTPCEVVIYKRMDLWDGVIKSVDIEGDITINYDFVSQGRWITVVKSINPEWMNLTNAALSFYVSANRDNNTLYIDLFDSEGNFRGFGLFLDFKGQKHVVVPISDNYFPKWHAGCPDFDEVEKLHFQLEHTLRWQPGLDRPISGSLSGQVSISNIQILYVEKENAEDLVLH